MYSYKLTYRTAKKTTIIFLGQKSQFTIYQTWCRNKEIPLKTIIGFCVYFVFCDKSLQTPRRFQIGFHPSRAFFTSIIKIKPYMLFIWRVGYVILTTE